MVDRFNRFKRVKDLFPNEEASSYDSSKDTLSDWRLIDFSFPKTDIKDNGKELIVTFDMPGLKKEDIKISIQGNIIEVKSKKNENVDSVDDYLSERIYRGFYRSIKLPVNITPEKSTAKYENDILIITAPKSNIEKSSISTE
jgi:HSP20 family molecular chaperone IbpA